MDDEKLKRQIGINIASYRKRIGLTQAGLAERLNYSDKAVSKWERGESVPDVITMVQLAEQFDITVNDLLVDPEALPGNPNNLEQAMTRVTEKTLKRKANKHIVLLLSSLLVWFVALFLYVMVSSFDIPYSWLAFLYAIPTNAIVLLSMRSAWHDFRWNRFYISTIMWGFLLSFHITLLIMHFNMWKLYLLGIPGQIAIWLWFRLFRPAKTKSENTQEELNHG